MSWPIAFVVPRIPPSGNALRGKKYKNPHDYKRLRETWEWELAAALTPEGRLRLKAAAVTSAMRVRITVVRNRELDFDNLVAGCKPVVDAMTNDGFLKDDSPAWARIEYSQAVKKSKPHTLFSFAPLEEIAPLAEL